MFFSVPLALSLLLCQSQAVPVAEVIKRDAELTIPISHVPVNLPGNFARTLQKHGLPVPRDVIPAVKRYRMFKKRQQLTGQSTATPPPTSDREWVGPLKIGNQTVNIMFDTGSTDLWVIGQNASATLRTGHNVYNTTKSKSWKPSNYSMSLTYVDGQNTVGPVGTDNVTLAGLTVANQYFGVAKSYSTGLALRTDLDGIMGLGFYANSHIYKNTTLARQRPWVENVLPQLKAPLFAVNLRHNQPGTISFGYSNSSAYKGNITYAPVIFSTAWWMVSAPTYSLGNTTYKSGNIYGAVVDTGSTTMVFPSAIASAYHAKVKGAYLSGAYWYVPCNASMPNLTLAVGPSANATIPGANMVHVPVSSTTCYSAMQGASMSYYIYGGPFFKTFYTVFNYGVNSNWGANTVKFGFATKS